MQQNINQYDSDEFRRFFIGTDLYKKLQEDFEILAFDDNWLNNWLKLNGGRTPRHFAACRKFSLIPFYYLKFLTDQNPSVIYDLGCGWNIFKKYIPNIIGVSGEPVNSKLYFGDIHGHVDDQYVKEHQGYFDSVFSINALHFHPLSQIRKVVLDFVSMIAPGGHGFLAINLARMLERDTVQFKNYTAEQLEEYVRTQLSDIPAEYKVFDLNFNNHGYQPDNAMDGNIRLICHKTI